ncbi:hypothetical protein GALMADRAFT_145003 [Galerina marginata CBS 339.88]|uniref:Uncharacterized protein n=1 Tax=Galerina marginata (strain CBS 339.88) TaxID=685588 RepID=A0A067SQM2_GALM3|nr:hypothetical protein GALMADRAFT_145003 [Galerina marginata CBS 339.88]
MSSTATTTMVLTPPPPTNNTLAPEERSRLLRSTRKLGAILGTTPLLVEHKPEPEPTSTAAPAIPPRHPNRTTARREGRIFHSPSSSYSSGSSSETLAVSPEPDYVFVRPTTRSAGYQVQAVFENASPSSSRSASPLPVQIQVQGPTSGSGSGTGSSASAAGTTLKRKHEGPLAPITIMFPLPGPSGSKATRSGAGKGRDKDRADRTDRAEKEKDKDRAKGRVAQPLLVRPPRAAPSSSLDASSSSTIDRHIKPDVHSNTNNNSLQKPPLSPVSSTFNMNVVPPSPTPTLPALPSRENGLSDREKRRKMAKLTRTLGENIPPELVFRAPSPTSNPAAASSSAPAQVSRRTSLSISRHHPRPSVTSVFDSFHKPTKFSAASASAQKFNPTSSLPPLAVAETPLPPPSQTQSQSQLREQLTDKTSKRRHRPRSLTLGSSSALASATAMLLHREKEATRGTTSLDILPQPHTQTQRPQQRAGLPLNPLSRHQQQKHQHSDLYAQPQASPRPFVSAVAPQPVGVPPRLESLRQSNGQNTGKGQGQGQSELLSAEFGRRKEREWSGEWNMKDMEDVARRLRGLKGR